MFWLLATLLVVGLAGTVISSARLYVGSQVAVQHTLVMRQVIADVLARLIDAETGQRGFLLTREDDFLVPYTHASRELPQKLALLQDLAKDDPEQAQTSREIYTLALAKLSELAETVHLNEAGDTDRAMTIVREGRGQRTMDALRRATAQMLAREAILLDLREQQSEQRQQHALMALIFVFAVVFGVLAAGILTVQRSASATKRLNDRLRESEAAYRELADNSSDLVVLIEHSGRVLYVSPSCQTLLGFSAAELIAGPLSKYVPDEERKQLAETVRVSREHPTGMPATFVHRVLTRSGSYRWFETRWTWTTAPDAYGERLQLTGRDIHARKLAEDELRTQTARLSSVLDSMADGVVVLDAERRFLVVNPAAREYIRQDQGDQAPPGSWATLHQTYLPDGSAFFPAESGPLTRALRGESVDAVELAIRDRYDNLRNFSVTARPIQDGSRVAGCVAVYRDTTEQRRAARRIEESERRWRNLSEASFEGMVVTQTGVVVDANTNLALWLGRRPEDLVGAIGLNLFAPEDREFVDEMSSDVESAYEARMLRSDGTLFPVEVRGREAQFAGEPVRIAVIRDITERKRREADAERHAELLRQLALRDELTGLFNRRGFLEHANQALLVLARSPRPASLLYADVNGLKAINDRFGHDVGDRAIVAVARILRSVLRESDIVARLGGDEFAMLAIDCTHEDLLAIRARVNASMEAFNTASGEPFTIAVSLGAVEYASDAPQGLSQLMEAADKRMYEQKQGSRSGAHGLGTIESLNAPRRMH